MFGNCNHWKVETIYPKFPNYFHYKRETFPTYFYCRVKEWRVTLGIPLALSTVSSLVPVSVSHNLRYGLGNY